MPTAEKERTIEQAKEWYSKSKGVVFTDYRGLSVKDMQTLRSNLKAKGGEIHVLKNTLFRVAAGTDVDQLPYEFHNGPTAVAFVYENESECTKAILDYAKTNKNLKVKGGFFAGKPYDAKQVQQLSELPPRDVLIAQVIGTIVAPLTSLIGVIEALYADPIRTIGAVADKVGESSPKAAAPAAPAAVAEEAPATPEASAEDAPAATPEDEPAPVTEAAAEETTSPEAEEAPADPTPETTTE